MNSVFSNTGLTIKFILALASYRMRLQTYLYVDTCMVIIFAMNA